MSLKSLCQSDRADAERRGSAGLHHITVGYCSYQTSNHGNISFLIDIIVFENRPPPKNCELQIFFTQSRARDLLICQQIL